MERVPSLEESVMLDRMKTDKNNSYPGANWGMWCMFRDYMESPLGQGLLREITTESLRRSRPPAKTA